MVHALDTNHSVRQRIAASLAAREPLTAGESLWLQQRGVPARYWTLNGYEQVKRLVAAGFDYLDLLRLVDLPADEIATHLETVPGDLPYVVEATAQGRTVQEIAAHLGIPRPTVYYHLNDLGIEPARIRAREITVSQQRKVEKLADMDMPYSEIAKRVGITYDQVRAAVKRSR